MNDTDLVHAVKEPFARIRMTTPVDTITARGQAMRYRHRLAAIGATVAAGAAGSALAVTLLVAGSTPAWTVTKKGDGTVEVTIRDLKDLNGLRHELRESGVRATFDFPIATASRGIDMACLHQTNPALRRAVTVRKSSDPHAAALLLHPSAIPPGDTLGIYWAGYSPDGYAGAAPSAGMGGLAPGPGGRTVRKAYKIPLAVAGDFTFLAVFLNSAGRCV